MDVAAVFADIDAQLVDGAAAAAVESKKKKAHDVSLSLLAVVSRARRQTRTPTRRCLLCAGRQQSRAGL